MSSSSRKSIGLNSHRNSSFEYKETLDATTRHLEDGSRIINQYKLGKMIGKGAYGSVYRANLLDDPESLFAIKEFGKTRLRKTRRAENFRRPPPGRGRGRGRAGAPMRGGRPIQEEESPQEADGDPLSLIRREIAILKKLHHPHLVHLYEVLDDPSKDELYMVFEYCADGAVIDIKLHEQVEPLGEDIARDYFVQIMLGVEYLHHHDIVHRDLKPDNILLQNDRTTCKIVDFGVSEFFIKPGDDMMKKSAGSPAFMSPELCKAGHGDFHGKDSDLWSLGVTFYCMVVGHLPFDKSQFLELYESIQSDSPIFPSHLSPNCKDLLEKMLNKDPSKRITIQQMRDHPFITKDGQEDVISMEENIRDLVEEVTAEELDSAINRIASVFTLARAISKFKR
ncbi:Pkinase-domain-containing protein, partial [Meira miltonrushii]